jgi:hypothetical protein
LRHAISFLDAGELLLSDFYPLGRPSLTDVD